VLIRTVGPDIELRGEPAVSAEIEYVGECFDDFFYRWEQGNVSAGRAYKHGVFNVLYTEI